MRVALIDTADLRSRSMMRYGDLVVEALEESVGTDACLVQRVRLALPAGIASRTPAAAWSFLHHACVTLRTATLRRAGFDVWHLLDGSHAYLLPWIPRPRVATVHDLIPTLQIAGRLAGRPPSRQARALMSLSLRGLRDADGTFADSPATAQDAKDTAAIAAARVTTVPLALTRRLEQAAAARSNGPSGREPAIVLHVGNDAFYKNRAGVLRVFARVRSRVPARLVMVGPGLDGELRALASSLGVGADVEVIGDVDDAELARRYVTARLLLFPSLYEGFGWPPLEAMAFGCPVVCSTAVAHVTGEAALVHSPDDEEGLAASCLAVLAQSDLAASLVKRGRARAREFSRKRLGESLLRVYRDVAGGQAAP